MPGPGDKDTDRSYATEQTPSSLWQVYCKQITPTETHLRSIYNGILGELQVGLEHHRESPHSWDKAKCDFMMLDCCLDKVPKGTEKGSYYAIDFGGTNIRAVYCKLDGHGNVEVDRISDTLRDEGVSATYPRGVLDSKAPAKLLFDAVAMRVKKLMEKTGDVKSPEKLPVGFTFSFGTKQSAIDSAVLVVWSKDYETGMQSADPVVNQDVCKLMNQAFARLGVPAYVNCCLNDTTGTMIAGGMEKSPKKPACLIGLIVGTGVNGCYFEPEAKNYGYHGNVINVETGGYSKNLPYCVVDVEIDFESSNRGHQQLEKCVSGLYLPEIIRLLILRCFRRCAPEKAWERNTLSTPSVAAIYAQDEGDTDMAGRVMLQEWNWEIGREDLVIVKSIVDAVFDRSAALIAATVAAMAKRTKRLQPAMGGVTVGVDGALYKKNPKYQKQVTRYLGCILGNQLAQWIYFQPTEDGSGKGAAYLAATIAATAGREEAV